MSRLSARNVVEIHAVLSASVADAAGAALAAAAVNLVVVGVSAVGSTVAGVAMPVELVELAGPEESVEVDVPSLAVVLSLGDVVEAADVVKDSAVAEGVVVGGLESDALATDEGRGFADDCLLEERLRADPADPLARLGFEDVFEDALESLAELGFDAEPEESPSVAAEATPCPTPTASPSPTAATKMPLRAARVPL